MTSALRKVSARPAEAGRASGTLAVTERLYVEQDMPKCEAHALARGLAVVYSTRCPGKPTPSEDSAALLPVGEHHAILAVADGVGGQPSGGAASRLTVQALAAAAGQGLDANGSLRPAVLDGFEAANQAVRALGAGAATTLIVVTLHHQPGMRAAARVYHAGDSMALILGNRGRVKHRTVSHSPVGYAEEAGLINERTALRHAERHLVSNALGSDQMKIEIGPSLELSALDTLVLGSDGLFDNLSTQAIVERARKGPLPLAGRRLADDCAARMRSQNGNGHGKPDDLTFILWRGSRKA